MVLVLLAIVAGASIRDRAMYVANELETSDRLRNLFEHWAVVDDDRVVNENISSAFCVYPQHVFHVYIRCSACSRHVCMSWLE